MASGYIHEEASFASLDDLDKSYIFLDEYNVLEEEISDLFNEVSISILKFQKIQLTRSKYTQNMCSNSR